MIKLLLLQTLALVVLLCRTTTIDAFTLITFDVDGTLVAGSGKKADTSAHSRAFGVAVGRLLSENGKPTLPVAEALPRRDYHGSTDGLILLRLAEATGLMPEDGVSEEGLQELFQAMYEYIGTLEDEEVAEGISPLPGVMNTLSILSTMKDQIACGLVTGNVEGIARRKMRAVGIWDAGAFAPASAKQRQREWEGTEDVAFLGGFGSDYCSRNIKDAARNHLDRGEQIAIAVRRCRSLFPDKELTRVVHVGDAPADILAAKSLCNAGNSICVGCVGVATGSYSASELKELAGEPIPGVWEPVILEEGLACEPALFLNACGL